MYKKYLVKCQIYDELLVEWVGTEFYFDTVDEVVNFIKNGVPEYYIKPLNIKIEAVLKLYKIDMSQYL